MKPIVYCVYAEYFDFNFDLDKSIEIFVDTFIKDGKTTNLKIFIAMEPDVISGLSDAIIHNQNDFDYILTFDNKILSNCKNSVLFEYGTTWIDSRFYNFPTKNFSVSTVCGHKQVTQNHRLRKRLWYRQNEIKIPTDFYRSNWGSTHHSVLTEFQVPPASDGGVENINNNKILGDSKLSLFDSMFHICIENSSQDYYFSEKLIDCLLTKTIPVYLGCTNIQNYFNIDGFVLCKNEDEIISSCNCLTEEFYNSKKDVIEENYKKAINWISYKDRLENKLKEIIFHIN